jgi:hypothetical protein
MALCERCRVVLQLPAFAPTPRPGDAAAGRRNVSVVVRRRCSLSFPLSCCCLPPFGVHAAYPGAVNGCVSRRASKTRRWACQDLRGCRW